MSCVMSLDSFLKGGTSRRTARPVALDGDGLLLRVPRSIASVGPVPEVRGTATEKGGPGAFRPRPGSPECRRWATNGQGDAGPVAGAGERLRGLRGDLPGRGGARTGRLSP